MVAFDAVVLVLAGVMHDAGSSSATTLANAGLVGDQLARADAILILVERRDISQS